MNDANAYVSEESFFIDEKNDDCLWSIVHTVHSENFEAWIH